MSGSTPNTAGSYISTIRVRGNLIGTALRSSRGRPQASSACDCCSKTESLAHILQVCPRPHASRIALHDKIIGLVEQALTRKGYTTCREPAIPTLAGIRKPNLLVSRGSAVTVLDVTVVADNADLALSHGRKCEYYDTPAVREWVRDRYGPGEVTFSAVALNWRGSMAIPSARGLRSLGKSGALLGLISFVTLERGSWIVNHFRRSAYRVRQYDNVPKDRQEWRGSSSPDTINKKRTKPQARSVSEGKGKLSCGGSFGES